MRRWRRRSVASEGVRTGRVDQDVAVEREVVERAGEEAVKVVHVASVVVVDGDAVGLWVVGVSSVGLGRGCCLVSLMVGVRSSVSSSIGLGAPATVCS